MVVTLKYFAYLGSDCTQIFTYFQIWLRFSSDFSRNSLVSRLCYCLSKSPDVETSMFKCHATRSYCKFFWLLVSKASLHKKAVSSSIAIHVFLAQASALQALPCRWLTGNNVSSPLLKSSAKPGSSSANWLR